MTSIDLYVELIKYANKADLPETSSRHSEQSRQSAVDEFEQLMDSSKDLIEQVRSNNRDIIDLKDRLATNSNPNKYNYITERIEKSCRSNKDTIGQLRTNLQQAGAIVEEARKISPNEPETFSKIYRKQHLAYKIDKILEEAYTIQKIVEKFSTDTRLKRVRLVLPEISEYEAMKLARKANGLDQAVMSKVTGKASLSLRYASKDVLEKTEGILRLYKSVYENLALIQYVAQLVSHQGYLIDTVYSHINYAHDYVAKAEANIVKEKGKHQTSRKKLCCIILIGIIVLAIIIVPIVVKVVKSKQAVS